MKHDSCIISTIPEVSFLLFSLANKTPHQDVAQLHALSAHNPIVTLSQAATPSGDFQNLRHEIIAAIQMSVNTRHSFDRGRNIRKSDGLLI